MAAALAGLLLAATANSVELRAPAELALTEAAALRVELLSADGLPHLVRLMGACATGARLEAGEPLEVPASGSLVASRMAFRADAPWESHHELQLVAVDQGSGLAVGTTSVALRVGADPSILPGLRRPLVIAGVLLITAAVLREALARRRSDSA